MGGKRGKRKRSIGGEATIGDVLTVSSLHKETQGEKVFTRGKRRKRLGKKM